ncbi:PTS transporter subunit EIIC [[Mycoplasma] mobile]|uniref:Sucrose-specific PTS System IIBC component n=1 Tax=Mycoplasma mobile (strain ATCC 43663 / 163K / NCTC 11711) TaxID=267748 RepID=Q6KHI0_MYCM1|nr:PTS transporter subunit EIIC [[Mycoplasma] mobile]AAT27950.1 sucrose-specific PTS System IIBC component [Mycoplasma mobile 163K]
MKQSEFKNSAELIIEAVGGKENISIFYHCATRLRFKLTDQSKINVNKIKAIKLAKGYNLEGEENQIIFGAGTVNKVHDELQNLTQKSTNQTSSPKQKHIWWNKNISFWSNLFLNLRWFVRSFAEIFIPLIPIFIAGGLSLALTNLVKAVADVNINQTAKSAVFFFELIGAGILGSLPAFVGYTSMKKYGGTPLIGLAIGIILVAPNLLNAYLVTGTLTSFPVGQIGITPGTQTNGGTIAVFALFPALPEFFQFRLIGYQAEIFPVLAIVALAFFVEKFLKRYTPEALAIIVVPLITIVFTLFLGFWIIGPIFKFISIGLTLAFSGIFQFTNFAWFGLGGAILGFAYPFLVVTGLHQGFLPIEAQLIARDGFTWITSIATISNISQGVVGLTLAIVFFLKKEKKNASLAISGGVSANLGITEPILFGINIPLKFAMVAAACGAAVGGYWVGMTQTMASSIGSASWIGFIQFDITATRLQAFIGNRSAALTNLAPIYNIAIASILSVFSSIGFTLIFLKTKWGKNSYNKFLSIQN